MKLVLSCTSSDSEYDADCSAALVNLTPKLARLALDRIDRFFAIRRMDPEIPWNQTDRALYELYFWGKWVDYFDLSAIEMEEAPYNGATYTELSQVYTGNSSLAIVPDEFAPSQKVTECDQMVIEEQGVRFYTIPRHSRITITTSTIDLAMLNHVAGTVTPNSTLS